MFSIEKARMSGFIFEREDEFNSFFLENVLSNGLECFETSENETDNAANDIIENYIIPITEWDADVVNSANHKTVMFWYLNYLYYRNFDKDNPVGMATDDIYLFFDSLKLV